MLATPSIGHITKRITAMARLGLLLASLLSVAIVWAQSAQIVTWGSYSVLVSEIEEGRFEVDDLGLMDVMLTRGLSETCSALRARTPVTLHLYAGDLIAWQTGADVFAPNDAPELVTQREATRQILHRALACTPTDGDLWLKLAIVARALDEPPAQVEHYLALSERYAPHEGWISTRRDRLF